METIYRLEIHVTDRCNLKCESCSHFSGPHHSGILTPSEVNHQMGLWSPRLRPSQLELLGGEPTLNPWLADIIPITRQHFPHSELKIVSNGLLLHKHPKLLKAILENDTSIRISFHSLYHDPRYEKIFSSVRELANQWIKQGAKISITPDDRNWTRRYYGDGSSMMPFNDHSPRSSWENCPCRIHMQLRKGHIWKCPILAYLPLQKKLFPELSPVWNLGLCYKPLSPLATDNEMHEFLGRQDEPQCGLCPEASHKFDSASVFLPENT